MRQWPCLRNGTSRSLPLSPSVYCLSLHLLYCCLSILAISTPLAASSKHMLFQAITHSLLDISCPTSPSPYSNALWSCLKKSRSKLAVTSSRTPWMQWTVVAPVSQWVGRIGTKCRSIKLCVRCTSCRSKERSVKSWVQGMVPSSDFVRLASAFRVEWQTTW
jgi:hypothetical protein